MSDVLHRDGACLDALTAAGRKAALDFLHGLPGRPAAVRPQPSVPLALPEGGIGGLGALDLFRRRCEAQLSGSAGPRYLGFVTGGTTPAALIGDWLAAAYDQCVTNDGDSVATSVERECLDMLRALFGLPESFAGAFVSGATQANLVALATARQWVGQRLGVDTAQEGVRALPEVPVLSAAPHVSIYKALASLGLGRSSVHLIDSLPGRVAVDPAALDAALSALAGTPSIVVASAGEVNTADFDDLRACALACHRHGAWLHVDGAFGLFAACDPQRAHLLDGIAEADSVATDGHKWLNVPYDSGIVFTRHLDLQEQVFRASAAYLGAGPDLLHRTPENSRRFRALPAWMTLIAYGREGYAGLVRRSCAIAADLGAELERLADVRLLSPVRLNVVCFAVGDGSPVVRDRFLAAMQADGRAFMTPTTFRGQAAVRAAFVNWSTRATDLPVIVAAVHDALEAARG